MDNSELLLVNTLLLECGLFLRLANDEHGKDAQTFRLLENRLIAKKERTPLLYNEIRTFHRSLGLK